MSELNRGESVLGGLASTGGIKLVHVGEGQAALLGPVPALNNPHPLGGTDSDAKTLWIIVPLKAFRLSRCVTGSQ